MKVKSVGYNQNREKFFTVGKVYEWSENSFITDDGFDFNTGSVKFAAGTDPKKWKLSKWYNFEVVNDFNKIVITTDGTTTTAKLYDGNKFIKSSTAKCSPDDTFDFNTGAKIAFDRLTGNGGKPIAEYDVNLFSKPVAHLEKCCMNYGEIGKETKFKDAIGRPLKIGDVVECFNNLNISFGDGVICENDGETFVSGLKLSAKNGKVKNGWKIIKTRGYVEVKSGETVDKITYVK